SQAKFPSAAAWAMRRTSTRPTRFFLSVSIPVQRMSVFEMDLSGSLPQYEFRKRYVISSSAYGVGQIKNSQQTPLGLHRVAQKIGAGHMIGTVFRSRKPIGLTWQGNQTLRSSIAFFGSKGCSMDS